MLHNSEGVSKISSTKYITIVEDAPSITKLLEKLLTSKGYAVEAYDTAEKGLKAMLQRPPDLLITDLRLPGMDGMELIGKIRQDLILQDIPVIMLSAHADLDTRVQGLEEADDFLGKPFHPSELYARVAALLRRRKSEGLHGALERMGGMAVVLQMLTLGYQEGVLILDDGMTATLSQGHIVGLSPLVESGDVQGIKTAASLMLRQEGGFRFIPDMPMPKKSKTLHINVNELLLEHAKNIDEERAKRTFDQPEVSAQTQQAQAITKQQAAQHGTRKQISAQQALSRAQNNAPKSNAVSKRPENKPLADNNAAHNKALQSLSKPQVAQPMEAMSKPTASLPSLEEKLKTNTKGLVILQDFKAAQQYMGSVSGMQSFRAMEAYSQKHKQMSVVFENNIFVVVVLGMSLADLPANTPIEVLA